MAIANRPSEITLPANNQGWANLYEFLCWQFPRIDSAIWLERLQDGKVFWFDGDKVTPDTPFSPSRRLCYFREVSAEPHIPFSEELVYQDEHLLIACKPHFLPVIPGGEYINECLLERLRQKYHAPDLVAVHRLDRETAGLVLFSKQVPSRADYYQLFASGQIEKSYLAVAHIAEHIPAEPGQQWQVQNRLEKSQPRFLMQQVEGEVNARSSIELLQRQGDLGLFKLTPHTGKTHQLRVHMLGLGMPLLHDKYYPQLQPKTALDFSQPLQLLAAELSFIDPLSGEKRAFRSNRQLAGWPENLKEGDMYRSGGLAFG
ncbi:pseudouridine synthase [Rheinheimera riviphila]|uniref:Pseudouridine synthase n=1 Tax=Rheinheimera riviphila TaxID=1834037 RepID=A0A437QM52_9GAMM|nr:pseudouridine synthase [Rheinheimera riviphila]RVU35593.1 pseudouridine synthase [Rheinheimera riviphila]